MSRRTTNRALPESLSANEFWDVLNAKWTFQIVALLAEEPMHFNAIKRHLGIPGSTLSARLEELCEQSIVSRSVEDTSPPRVEYSLTPKGEEIATVIDQLAEIERRWAE